MNFKDEAKRKECVNFKDEKAGSRKATKMESVDLAPITKYTPATNKLLHYKWGDGNVAPLKQFT